MFNLLANSLVMEGLKTFLLGILVVFFGITIIVLCVYGAGALFKKFDAVKEKKAEAPATKLNEEEKVVVEVGEVPEHVKVAIVAAISAYYFSEKSNCDFKVKKIKRI